AVLEDEGQAGDEERGLLEPGGDGLDVVGGVVGEDGLVVPPAHGGAGGSLLAGLGLAGVLAGDQGGALALVGDEGAVLVAGAGRAAVEGDVVLSVEPVDAHVEPVGQGVDDRGADTVQASGALGVAAAAELP